MTDKVLTVKPSDTLILEYVKLPMTDLSVRFLWRFQSPIPTCWEESRFSLCALINTSGHETEVPESKFTDAARLKELLVKKAREEWGFLLGKAETDEEREVLKSFWTGDYVDLVECEIRKIIKEQTQQEQK